MHTASHGCSPLRYGAHGPQAPSHSSGWQIFQLSHAAVQLLITAAAVTVPCAVCAMAESHSCPLQCIQLRRRAHEYHSRSCRIEQCVQQYGSRLMQLMATVAPRVCARVQCESETCVVWLIIRRPMLVNCYMCLEEAITSLFQS